MDYISDILRALVQHQLLLACMPLVPITSLLECVLYPYATDGYLDNTETTPGSLLVLLLHIGNRERMSGAKRSGQRVNRSIEVEKNRPDVRSQQR